MTARRLASEWIHLGLGAVAEPQPVFDTMEWYDRYEQRHAADGAEGRLVALHRFESDWAMWEMHPEGAEVVICTAGMLTLVQEIDAAEVRTLLRAGDYAINPPGVWHTADVIEGEAEAIFITPGKGTRHRPRRAG